MSLYVAVWNAGRAITSQEAVQVFDRLMDGDAADGLLLPDVRVAQFVDELIGEYPRFDDLPPGGIEYSPWGRDPDIGPASVILSVVWARAEEVVRRVFALSRKHGLSFYDTETQLISLPDELVSATGVMLNCPWLHGDLPASPELLADLVPFLEKRNDPFVILEIEPEIYMQTLWTEDGYLLEYRSGSAAEHYEAERHLEAREVVEALTDYALGGVEWKKKHTFRRLEF